MTRRAYLFAGGGTGGHIYPALAIIEELNRLDPGSTSELLVSDRAIDTTILMDSGIPFAKLPAKPFGSRPSSFMKFAMSWKPSVRKARNAIRRLRTDHDSVTLIAMGGFVAAPAAHGAHRERTRVVLVNLDAVPGKANELIARHAHEIYSACDIEGHEHWTRIPPIVRASELPNTDPSSARIRFGLDPNARTLLITGGSTGARSINSYIAMFVEANPIDLHGWQIIHQTGNQLDDAQLGKLEQIYRDNAIRAWVGRYIDDIGNAYTAADLMIGRCGAGSVAEVWGANLPSVFFPYPYHKDEHQRHNAKPLVGVGGAILCTDHIDPDTNLEAHTGALRELLRSDTRRDSMRDALRSLGPPDGASRIARALIEHDPNP